MLTKAIVSTSANPFHFGHLDLYKKAKQIFREVKVVIAQNSDKPIPKNLKFHLNAYDIPYEIIKDKTIADYCAENRITHIIRGIRNGVDAEYELKLDFANKEINPNVQTLFIPTSDTFANISSSTIRELLRYKKYDIVKKYMDEDAMWRYVNGIEYICCFGKSFIGKTEYLNSKNGKETLFGDVTLDVTDCDKHFWETSRLIYGDQTDRLIWSSKVIVYDKLKSVETKKKELLNEDLLNEEFWDKFFEKQYGKILDWSSVGFYYDLIPMKYRSKMYFVELTLDEYNRSFYTADKREKIKSLDSIYTLPKIIDTSVNLSKSKRIVI